MTLVTENCQIRSKREKLNLNYVVLEIGQILQDQSSGTSARHCCIVLKLGSLDNTMIQRLRDFELWLLWAVMANA